MSKTFRLKRLSRGFFFDGNQKIDSDLDGTVMAENKVMAVKNCENFKHAKINLCKLLLKLTVTKGSFSMTIISEGD